MEAIAACNLGGFRQGIEDMNAGRTVSLDEFTAGAAACRQAPCWSRRHLLLEQSAQDGVALLGQEWAAERKRQRESLE